MRKLNPYRIFTLHIGGILPTKMRVEALGAYLQDFGKLLGPEIDARFDSVKKGSTNLSVRVRPEQEQDVRNRLYLIRTNQAPQDAYVAKASLLERLSKDGCKGAALLDSSLKTLIEFPVSPVVEVFKPLPTLVKAGSVQGQIIGIKGKRDTVSVLIEDVDGYVYNCNARREIARGLGKHIFGKVIRAFGSGKWKRGDDGVWNVEDFQIASFDETLDDSSFSDAIVALRKINAGWKRLDDPQEALRKIRHGEDE